MYCPSCGFENPAGSKFCSGCGVSLQHRCPSCGHEQLPQARFCGECGAQLTASGKASPAPSRSHTVHPPVGKGKRAAPSRRTTGEPPGKALPAGSEAERRQLTVMFCDLVGSSALSEQLDPEDLREVVRAYQEVCAAVICRYDGHIAQYLGDGVLVYFGYPVAHEDDAQRAVRAGLGILAELQRLNAQFQQTAGAMQKWSLQVRIGIHTGLAVVGEMGKGERREQIALGDAPNIASRLQGIADPDAVVISAATYRLIQGYFECRDLGPQMLKGISTPVPVYRVLSESGVRSRLEVALPTGLTPLVGREHEVGLFLERWEQAKQGMGQVVLLHGEAGIGKSRLVHVLKERVAEEPHAWLECRCSPYYQHSALYPVIDLLQRALGFRREDSPQEKLSKLEEALGQYSFVLSEVVPLFASLLSLPLPDRYFPLALTPQRQKQKTQEALLAWLLEAAERRLVLSVWEDLQWIDPSTLELLGLFIDQAPTARIYILLTARLEFSPPWPLRSHLSQITLSRLPRKQVEVMVEKVAGGKTLPSEVVQQVVTKTDGVPLFVEELTKVVVESVGAHGRAPLQSFTIPTTLHDSLMARLDRLDTAKETAQLGATIGRELTYELIQAVSPLDEATLQRELTRLVEAELLYQKGLPPQARYLFKHALIQEAAYQSLLKSKRQQYHQQIAQVLQKRFPEAIEAHPELLAHHYTEAGLIEQAIPYWQQAGQRASERSANVEAISHLTKGLELLKTLPDTPERTQQELRLQLALSDPLQATKGYAAPEVEHAYARALALCRQLGEPPQLFVVLGGLLGVYVGRGELRTAHELGEQLLALAQRGHSPAALLAAHYLLGEDLLSLGEFVLAREHLEQGIAFIAQRQRPRRRMQDPGVACLSNAAMALWCLGYPDQALLQRSHEALTLAQELSHPYSLAWALTWVVYLHQVRREGHLAQERAEVLIALCGEQGFAQLLATGTLMRGWALVEQGQAEAGIAQIRQGLAARRATGAELYRPWFLTLLAEAYGKVGQSEEGLTVLAEALATVDKTGERFWEAELYRLKGTLTLQSKVQGPKSKVEEEAEECFWKAIEIARRQQAKSLELRAVMSLSRLWQQQGKKEEARRMLAEIYGWFTEGFDTADLQEAKALLEELSGRHEARGRKQG